MEHHEAGPNPGSLIWPVSNDLHNSHPRLSRIRLLMVRVRVQSHPDILETYSGTFERLNRDCDIPNSRRDGSYGVHKVQGWFYHTSLRDYEVRTFAQLRAASSA